MIAKIIPLIKLSRQLSSFDYNAPSQMQSRLKNGALVEIPFRNSQAAGIVISVQDIPQDPCLKNILRICDKEIFLYEPLLELIRWASFYYAASPSMLMRNIVPKIPVKKTDTYPAWKKIPFVKPKIFKSEAEKITDILKTIKQKNKILFHWSEYKNKIAIYRKLLEKSSADGQIILIIPQINQILDFIKYLPDELRNKTSILHSKMSANAYWQEWNNVRKNKSSVIIGSRQAIFSPVRNLKMVIIDEEQNQSHKQWDQNPRYHTLEIAVKLQEIVKNKLLIASSAPSISTYHFALDNKYEIIKEENKNIKISTINMLDERKNKNFSILSEEAENEITKNLADKKKSLIYINRRGNSKFALCQDCRYIPLCPNCNLPLSIHKNQALNNLTLTCHHCSYKEPLQISCPKCRGANIKYMGTGAEKTQEYFKKKFPGAKIIRLDTDAISEKNFLSLENADIIIGTNALFSFNFPLDINFVLILNIDTNLQIPDFRAYENMLQIINQFKILISHNFSSALMIQTYSENNPFLKNISRDYHSFYEEEAGKRKLLHYPPFCQLIKLTLKHRDSNMIKVETSRMMNFLKENFTDDKEIEFFENNAEIMKFKKYTKEIVIKNLGAPDKLQAWLIKNIPSSWIIDIDPQEI